MMKRAFTLIEVNMAMLIMAGGILSLVGLYALGFRENSQSVEDVGGAAVADALLSEVTRCLSNPELTWSQFDSITTYPDTGWMAYLSEDGNSLVCKNDPTALGRTVLNSVNKGGYGISVPADANNLKWGMVVSREEKSSVVTVAVRVTRDARVLMSQPLYVTQVRFQGKPE